MHHYGSSFPPVKADFFNNAVRRIDLSSGSVTTLAGNYNIGGGPPNNGGRADGVGTLATLLKPTGISLNSAGTFALVVSATGSVFD